MNRILVPLDGSELSEKALTIVEKMVGADIELLLVRVVNPVGALASADAMEEAENYLDGAAGLCQRRHPETSVRVILTTGPVAETLLEVAEDEAAGLIVMTTHGAGGLGRWLMGSVAEKVVRHSPCPVLTVGRRSLEAM